MSRGDQIPDSLQQLLLEFDFIFQEPKKLHLYRSHDHQIFLKEGNGPINIRPYRHSSLQEDVVEKMNEELLAAGLLRHNISSFSSPMVLAKKKDCS